MAEKLRQSELIPVSGIYLDKIIKEMTVNKYSQLAVMTKSDKLVNITSTPHFVGIFDEQDSYYQMSVWLWSQSLSFEIRTKKNSAERHPDFYAGIFFRWAIEHFNKIKVPFNNIKGIWYTTSDNYREFMQTYHETEDKVQAALSTWTGRMSVLNGFPHISRKDIKIYSQTKSDPAKITAFFWK